MRGIPLGPGAISFALVLGCGKAPTSPSSQAQIEPADPGNLLHVAAPGRYRGAGAALEEPLTLDWDEPRGRLIVGQPGDHEIVAVNLLTRDEKVISRESAPIGYQGVRVGATTGSIFVSIGIDGIIRLDTAGNRRLEWPNASYSFLISSNERRLLVGTTLVERSTDAQQVLGLTGRPLAISSDGNQIAELIEGPNDGSNHHPQTLYVFTKSTGAARVVFQEQAYTTGGIMAVTFVDGTLNIVVERVGSGTVAAVPVTLLEWDEGTRTERVLGTIPTGWAACATWSASTHMAVVVGRDDASSSNPLIFRFRIYALKAGNTRVIGSADLFTLSDCTLSPSGLWFVFGNSTGRSTGPDRNLSLKRVPTT